MDKLLVTRDRLKHGGPTDHAHRKRHRKRVQVDVNGRGERPIHDTNVSYANMCCHSLKVNGAIFVEGNDGGLEPSSAPLPDGCDATDDVDPLDSVSVGGLSEEGSANSTHGKLTWQTPTKELQDEFIRTHCRRHLFRVQPKPAGGRSPYTKELVKKKQYVTIVKQHEIRDAKFDSQCNILLSTQSSVQLYDRNGVFKEKLYERRVTEPWGLHVHAGSGNVFVSDAAEDCVKEFNALGIVVQEYGKVAGPRGVTVTDTDYLIVCSGSEGAVHVYDRSANLVTIVGGKILSAPTSVIAFQNSVLVSDTTGVVGFNVCGEVDFVYKQESEEGRPCCLCADSRHGYVLLTDGSKRRVVALTQEMNRAVKVKETSTSATLCAVSGYGQLLVGEVREGGTALKVFRLK